MPAPAPFDLGGWLKVAPIHPGSPAYALALERLDATYRAGALAVFAGAGISMAGPSCVPGGEEIRERLLRAMVEALQSNGLDAEAARIRTYLGSRPIELLLDAFTEVHGRQALGLLAPLDVLRDNRNHYCIARLAHGNSMTRVITLNFDVLIEIALDRLERSYVVRCPLGKDLVRHHRNSIAAVNILKPHGSFALPGDTRSVDNLATTLSEIRDRPDERTAGALSALLKGASVLLVIGYRGEDWDLLPLIARALEENPRLHLVWVKFEPEPPREMDSRASSSAVNGLSLGARDMIRAFVQRAFLLIGDPSVLLAGLVARNWPEETDRIPPVASCSHVPAFDPTQFLEPTVETVLSAAHALQDIARGDTDRLLAYLAEHPAIASDPRLRQSYANLAAWRRHIRAGPGDQDVGIALRECALRANRELGRSDTELASDLISTGYQYLSYAKPKRSHLRWPLKCVHHWWMGRRYLARGAAAGSDLQKGTAAYYRADYRHAFWMPLLLFGHRALAFVRRTVFQLLVCRAYDRAGREKAHLMDREYFFLRRLEAQIIGGSIRTEREELDRQLGQIQAYFMLTRQMDHLRNVCATRALMTFASNPNDPAVDRYMECAFLDKDQLSDAVPAQDLIENDPCVALLVELVSSSPDDVTLTSSGYKRYSLFQRFMRPERLSFSEALRRFG